MIPVGGVNFRKCCLRICVRVLGLRFALYVAVKAQCRHRNLRTMHVAHSEVIFGLVVKS